MSFRVRKASVFRPRPPPTDSVSMITQVVAPPVTPTPTTQRRVAKALTFRPTPTAPRPVRDDVSVISAPLAPQRREFVRRRIPPPPERIDVLPSRIVERPSGERVEVFPQAPREFVGQRPRTQAGQVVLLTPETFRQDVTRVSTPEGIETRTETTLPFTIFSFREQQAMKTAQQKEIERRRKILGTVTTPRDIGAFAGLGGIILTRPEARGVALEEFGAGFASPFVELGETAVDISRGEFGGRIREQPTFLSDLISVGGAQVRGFFGGDAPAPSETFESFAIRQEAKTPQRATGELFGEVALTLGTLGVGKVVQIGAKALPTAIRTVTAIFKGAGKTGIPKFNTKAVQGATKTKTQSVLKKELTGFNKKVDKIDKKFGKLDQKELKVNKSKLLTQTQKNKRVNKIRKQRFKLSREEAGLRKQANKFVGLVRESAIAKAPAKRLFAGRKETEFTSAIFGLGRGAGRPLDDFGIGFRSFTGRGTRPPKPPRPPTPPTEGRIIGSGGQVSIQVAKVVQKIQNGRVTSSQLKQVSTQISKQQKKLLKQPKTKQVLQQQKQLKKQKTKLKQAQQTIKKRKKKGQTADISFEQVFRFPQRLKPRLGLRTGLAVTPRLATRLATRQALIPFQTVRPKQAQKQDVAFVPFAPTTTRQVFGEAVVTRKVQDDFATIFKPITKPTKTDVGFIPTTPIVTTRIKTPTTTRQVTRGVFPPILFGESERRRRERRGRKSRLGARLFDIADEPFGEVTVGLGFFVEQRRGREEETIAEAIGLDDLDDIEMFEPITRQERQARKRLGINGKKRKDEFVAGIDLDSFF